MNNPSPAQPTTRDAQHIHLLESLVSIASPSGQEDAAVQHLVDWMSAQGLAAHIDAAGNAVGMAGSGPRTLVMLGHIDTFGGMLPIRRDGQLLYGRGTVDAKGPLCAFAAAAAQAHIPDGWHVVVIGAVEEECPTSAGAHYAVTQYTPELCIIGEPSRWDRLTLGYKGRLIASWEVHTGLAHSANPAASPAERAFEAWERIRGYASRFNHGRDKAFEQLLITLHGVNTGDDGVHGWARAVFGFRLPPDLSPDALEADLKALLADESTALTFSSHTHAYAAARDTSLSRLFRAAIRAHGGTPAFVYKTGTSDMNIAGPAWNCPILAYGAGDSALDHTPDEHIDLDEYLHSIHVLTHVIQSLSV